MGFMNYTLVGSDNAADMAADIYSAMIKRLRRQMRKRDNLYNTDGVDDVVMFIREVISRAPVQARTFDYNNQISGLVDECIGQYEKIQESFPEWEDKPSRLYRNFVKNSIRELKSFRKTLKK